MKIKAEYIWIDGKTPTAKLRSKTKIMDQGTEPPIWDLMDPVQNKQQEINLIVFLKPVAQFPDPIRGGDNILVMCEVLNVDIEDLRKGIVPEFLTMLRGVIDSPDIPLNVSRSYLQADGNVKKISNYITRKVADKLKSLFKKDRESFQDKWNDIKVVIEYGMLSEDKFFEKGEKILRSIQPLLVTI